MLESSRTSRAQNELLNKIKSEVDREIKSRSFTSQIFKPHAGPSAMSRAAENGYSKLAKDLREKLRPSFPDIGFYFDLRPARSLDLSKIRDTKDQIIPYEVHDWVLTDYMVGYDPDFLNEMKQRRERTRRVNGFPSYTVRQGDNLWDIAQRTYGRGSFWNVIYQANEESIGPDPDFLLAGFQIELPSLELPDFTGRSTNDRSVPPGEYVINMGTGTGKAALVGGPCVAAEFTNVNLPPVTQKIGNKTFSLVLNLTGKLQAQDMRTISDLQCFTLKPHTKALQTGVKLMGDSLTIDYDMGAAGLKGLNIKTALVKGENFAISLSASGPNVYSGEVERKDLRFKENDFEFTLSLALKATVTETTKHDDESGPTQPEAELSTEEKQAPALLQQEFPYSGELMMQYLIFILILRLSKYRQPAPSIKWFKEIMERSQFEGMATRIRSEVHQVSS